MGVVNTLFALKSLLDLQTDIEHTYSAALSGGIQVLFQVPHTLVIL